MGKEKYDEYIKQVEALQKTAEDCGIQMLFMDSYGNFVSSTKDAVSIGGLLLGNMLRQDSFSEIVEHIISIKSKAKSELSDEIKRIRKHDAETEEKQDTEEFLKKFYGK